VIDRNGSPLTVGSLFGRMTVVNEKNEGFDRVFDLVGGHGRFQWRLLFIVSLQVKEILECNCCSWDIKA